MATTKYTLLPQEPHELWQTAASPFILPTSWQTLYPRCQKCGGNAPNVCGDVWPDKWWEDDMLGLMYQGHIPPAHRSAPWEAYYIDYRVPYPAAVVPQTPSMIQTQWPEYGLGYGNGPMTPPNSPGAMRNMSAYGLPRPRAPTSPTLNVRSTGTVQFF
jgi:hypothetical protein